jgi:PhzF family phenazine biosynthesis protein
MIDLSLLFLSPQKSPSVRQCSYFDTSLTMELDYLTLDTFTSQRYSGGPLALVKVPLKHRIALSKEQKQLIAREFNLPETLFLHEPPMGKKANEFDAEIFTVAEELPFAVHSVMGAIWYCLHVLLAINRDVEAKLTVRTKFGGIGGSFVPGRDNIALAQLPHNFHMNSVRVPYGQIDVTRPPSSSITNVETGFPVVSIMKGITFILADVADLAMLAASRFGKNPVIHVDMDKEWNEGLNGILYYFVSSSSDDEHIEIQTNLTPAQAKDTAPGSAACALACFLSVKAKQPRTKYRYWVTQGVDIGRKSEMEIIVLTDAEGSGVDELELCGRAVVVSLGRLRV